MKQHSVFGAATCMLHVCTLYTIAHVCFFYRRFLYEILHTKTFQGLSFWGVPLPWEDFTPSEEDLDQGAGPPKSWQTSADERGAAASERRPAIYLSIYI